MRVVRSFKVQKYSTSEIKDSLLNWSENFHEAMWFDSNDYQQSHSDFDAVLAVDALTSLKTDAFNAFDDLESYQSTIGDWLFGYLSYDLKNDIEALKSENIDMLKFPELFFFQPKKIIFLKGNTLHFHYLRMVEEDITEDLDLLYGKTNQKNATPPVSPVKIKLRIHKDEYFKKVQSLLEYIHRGDIYEANFCQEFYAEDVLLYPLTVYKQLNQISQPPFAAYVKTDDRYMMSASPERYLRKEGNKIITQPIKGTAGRSFDPEEDLRLKKGLEHDPKERSENIMIVDLVRNDLSRHAVKGSVKVEELCKVYTFKQVHQLISTVTSRIDESVSPVTIIKDSFPMGSMTGAPKISAMKIIEELEESKRGLYSGAVGYFTPGGDFDFSVVIRSIFYNARNKYVSYSVGGAITAASVPEKEYEECLIKAKAMREVLGVSQKIS